MGRAELTVMLRALLASADELGPGEVKERLNDAADAVLRAGAAMVRAGYAP